MLPPDATPITTEQLLQKIGELTILNSVLQSRITILQAELKEASSEKYFTEPKVIPDKERM